MISTTVMYGVSPKPSLIEKAVAELGPELASVVTVRVLWSKKLNPARGDEFHASEAKAEWVRWYSAEFSGTPGAVRAFVESIVQSGCTTPTFDAWWEMIVYDDMLEA